MILSHRAAVTLSGRGLPKPWAARAIRRASASESFSTFVTLLHPGRTHWRSAPRRCGGGKEEASRARGLATNEGRELHGGRADKNQSAAERADGG
jgi:hypothetical protein